MQDQEIRQSQTCRRSTQRQGQAESRWFSGAETKQARVCWNALITEADCDQPILFFLTSVKTPLPAADDDVAETPAHGGRQPAPPAAFLRVSLSTIITYLQGLTAVYCFKLQHRNNKIVLFLVNKPRDFFTFSVSNPPGEHLHPVLFTHLDNLISISNSRVCLFKDMSYLPEVLRSR